MKEIYTIGHSTHPPGIFTDLLKQHSIEVVCDVRSQPYSKYTPQFSQEALCTELKKNNIKYIFLGRELGVRSSDPEKYLNGKVQYDLLAMTEQFQAGLIRVKSGSESYKIALMCAEKDPINCHRAILVCRHLKRLNDRIFHIHTSGDIESHSMLEDRLLDLHKFGDDDLFMGRNDKLEIAYKLQGEKIAYEISGESDKDE